MSSLAIHCILVSNFKILSPPGYSNALKCISIKGLSFAKLSFTTLTVYMQIFVVSKVLQGSFLLLYISHIGCICLTFLQCAFSNVLSKYLW